MKPATSKRHKIWIGTIVLFWLAAGIAVPLFFDFSGDELQFENSGVVAAPRDSFQITDTLGLDAARNVRISGGRLGLAASTDAPLTAEQTALLVKQGQAVLLLDNSELTIGVPNLQSATAGPSAPLVQALQAGDFKALKLRQSIIIVALPNGHRERLTKADLHIVPSSRGVVEVKGQGFWRGQRSQFSMSAGAVTNDGLVPVKIKFKATLLDFAYEGQFDMNSAQAVRGPLKVHVKDTERLANALGTSWPIGTSVQDVRIDGPVRWEGTTLAFDAAKVSVGENTGQGTVSLETAHDQALISSTLAFDRLDVAPYLPASVTDHRVLAWQWWSKIVSTLSQPAAPHINADIRLSTKALRAGDKSFGPAAATISLKNGKLAADVAEITLGAGTATGQISIDFNRYLPKLALRGRIDGVESSYFTTFVADTPTLKGRGRLIADLTSQGAGIQEIVAELKGRIEFAMVDGGSVGISVAQIMAQKVGETSASAGQIVDNALLSRTPVTQLEAVLKIHDGIAELVSASAEHSEGSIKFGGSFDLAKRIYDLRLLCLDKGAMPSRAGGASTGKSQALPKPSAKNEYSAVSMHSGVLLGLRSGATLPPEWSPIGGDVPTGGAHLQSISGTLEELERAMDGPAEAY